MDYGLSELPNGVRVVSVPMRERSSAGVGVWVRTGGRFEPKKLCGISHMLEHMVFKGTQKRTTQQIKREIEGVGGMLNAYTSEESTCYFSKLMKEHHARALDVLSDMVAHAVLHATELEKERTVILEEIKMYRDLPSHYVHELMGELLWPDQPLGRPVSGTAESVTSLSRTDLLAYRDRYYQPKNILVGFSGSMAHEDLLDLVAGIFPERKVASGPSFSKADSRQAAPKTFFLNKQTEQTHLVIGMHGLSRYNPDRYKLALLNVILGANMSSRLFEEVREKRGLAYEIRSGMNYFHDTGAFSISVGVETEKAPLAIAVVLRELAKICAKPVSAKELRRAKDYFLSQLNMALEDTLEHLLWVGEYVLDRRELPDCEKIRRRVEAVTEKDVREMAGQIFKTENLNLALIGPVSDEVQRRIRENFEMPALSKK